MNVPDTVVQNLPIRSLIVGLEVANRAFALATALLARGTADTRLIQDGPRA